MNVPAMPAAVAGNGSAGRSCGRTDHGRHRGFSQSRSSAARVPGGQQGGSCFDDLARLAVDRRRASTRRPSSPASSSARSWAPPASARASPYRTRACRDWRARPASSSGLPLRSTTTHSTMRRSISSSCCWRPSRRERGAAQGAGPDCPAPARSRGRRHVCAPSGARARRLRAAATQGARTGGMSHAAAG